VEVKTAGRVAMSSLARRCVGTGNAGGKCAARKAGAKAIGAVKAGAEASGVEAALKGVSAEKVERVAIFDGDLAATKGADAPSPVAVGRKTTMMKTMKAMETSKTADAANSGKVDGASGAVATPPWTRQIMPAA
jgi:hypothetical protein